MISINFHLSTSMQIMVAQLDTCVTLTLSSNEDEVVYYLKTVEDAREILNTMQKALNQHTT